MQAGIVRQLTSAKKSSSSPAWSPDGSRLAFVSDRSDKRQIYVINPSAGEAEAVTSVEDGVNAFAWAPDGLRLAYTSIELTKGAFTVGSFAWSPDGTAIAFDHRLDDDPANGGTADISIVTVAGGATRALVTQDGPDTHPVWSPDGSRIAFETAMANRSFYYSNALIATIPASGGPIDVLTSSFDEDPSLVGWTPTGIYFAGSFRTWAFLYRIDPATKSSRGRARTAPRSKASCTSRSTST